MKSVLTLFMLAVFAMFAAVDNAEAILSPEADTFLTCLEVEAVSLAPSAVVLEYAAVREAEAETVSDVMKWPHERGLDETGLDSQHLHDYESASSTAEGGSGRDGILPGGASRLE